MGDRKFMESVSLWIWSERDAGILGEPQGLVEMRVIKYVPEPTDDLTIGPRYLASQDRDGEIAITAREVGPLIRRDQREANSTKQDESAHRSHRDNLLFLRSIPF